MHDRIVVRLPATYAHDALERDLEIGAVINSNRRFVYLSCNESERQEILGDAAFYADPSMGFSDSVPDVVRSARLVPAAVLNAENLNQEAPADAVPAPRSSTWDAKPEPLTRYVIVLDNFRQGVAPSFMSDPDGSRFNRNRENAIVFLCRERAEIELRLLKKTWAPGAFKRLRLEAVE